MVMLQFQAFVAERIGANAWEDVRTRAGLARRSYLETGIYPDEELTQLVAAARELSRTPAPALIESFGEYLVPSLVTAYGALLPAEWTALDVIEHTEEMIHRVVRREQPGAAPPPLRATRVSPNEVRVSYTSARRLCALARGICRGLGRHYREVLEVEEPSCMLRGDRTCELVVRRSG